MPELQGFYDRLPVELQHLAITGEGLRIAATRYGPGFGRLLREVEGRSSWSASQIERLRDQRLRAFVKHAFEHVPHYRDLGRSSRVRPDDIRSLADLSQLPILSKAEVQSDVSRFQAEGMRKRNSVPAHTSGSTGAGLRFMTTRDATR
ncbi:MAG TPA: hypothetical protein VJ777_01970, partial [Mycobacterium sp.]|nr:hypothetical protein [Mycobacterium sp.]